MGQIVLDIKNEDKGKYLMDFLRQIDFVEIKHVLDKTKKNKAHDIVDDIDKMTWNMGKKLYQSRDEIYER